MKEYNFLEKTLIDSNIYNKIKNLFIKTMKKI